jgi:S-(hydroxymethyl)glutathione dehydrogenase/alcohol dehydrogenase
MKTKAAILVQINKPLSVEELILPRLKTGQVLVKVAYSGLCRSQLNEVQGLKGEDKYLPHTLGHEGSGIVQGVGPGVKKVKAGDHVVLTWIKASGRDVPSTIYKRNNGTDVNSGAISTFMEHAIISENRLVKIPQKMPLRQAALLGCAVLTGAGIIRNTASVKRGSTVAVFGVGGIGLSAILQAQLAKAKVIIAVDKFDEKLKIACKAGATHTVNVQKEDPLLRISEFTEGQGVDYAIEAAGVRQAMETAFQTVRDNGGLCVLAGNLAQGELINLNPFDLIKGKRIKGSWGGESRPDKDIPYYVNLYLSGRLNLEILITHTYRLGEINQAIDAIGKESIGRVLIEMEF